MSARCDRINCRLGQNHADLRVISYYGHTGNLVLETASLGREDAASSLSNADGAAWAVLSADTLRTAMLQVESLPSPPGERGVRWTRGLVFAVTKPATVKVTSSAKACLRPIGSSTIAAWKRDITTAKGSLNRTKRQGGWGAVSAIVGHQTKTKWTARSLKTLKGVLQRCRACDDDS
jgi:hypothetical protein